VKLTGEVASQEKANEPKKITELVKGCIQPFGRV